MERQAVPRQLRPLLDAQFGRVGATHKFRRVAIGPNHSTADSVQVSLESFRGCRSMSFVARWPRFVPSSVCLRTCHSDPPIWAWARSNLCWSESWRGCAIFLWCAWREGVARRCHDAQDVNVNTTWSQCDPSFSPMKDLVQAISVQGLL